MEKENINTLKYISYTHLMSNLIEISLKDCSDHNLLPILIVDNYTSKILSSILKMSDLINRGITSIELIENKKSKNENYGAIYFISPTYKSCNLVIEDFIDADNPAYNRIYLFFSHKLSENLLEKITIEGIIKHTIYIKEFNLSFSIFDENIFVFDWESGLKIFNCNNEKELKLLETITKKLFTVCSILNTRPYIQYQKNSKLCTKLSEMLEDSFNKNIVMKDKIKEGIILLTDRSLDLISPLLHDCNYLALCKDLFDIKNKKIQINQKIIELSDINEFWNSFKYKHITEVFEELKKNFEIYENNELNKHNKKLNFVEMANYLEQKENYIVKISKLIEQLYLADKLNEKYKNNHINELIELEQDIILDKINNKEMSAKISDIKQNLNIKKEDYLRLLLIFYLNNKGKQYKEILYNNLFKEENDLINNLNIILNTYNKKSEEDIKKYNQEKVKPFLSTLIYNASNYLLDEQQFPFYNYKKDEIKKYMVENKPLILFNIGGLSYNEISSIERMQKSNNMSSKFYIGTTCIISASEYINQLRNINNNYEKEIKIDCLEDIEEKDADSIAINVFSNINNNKINLDEDMPSEKEKLLDDSDIIYI